MDADVAVVGGGPAGAVAGYELARRGFSVMLFEREKLPRYKACGGGVPGKVIRALPFEVDMGRFLECTADEFRLAGKRPVTRNTAGGDWGVMRAEFDMVLLRKACEVGVELKEKVRVRSVEAGTHYCELLTDEGSFRARAVVGADGVHSIVARSVGLASAQETGIGLEAEIPRSESEDLRRTLFLDFCAIPDGYAWIFPKREGVSVGMFTTRRKFKGIRHLLTRYLRRRGLLGHGDEVFMRGHAVPIGGRARRLQSGRVLLVGDAAGLVDPFLGEGIYYAVKSARLAAGAIDDFLSGRTSRGCGLTGYSASVKREIGRDLRLARIFGRAFHAAPEFAYSLTLEDPVACEYCVGLVAGELSYAEFLRMLAIRMPLSILPASWRWLREMW